MKWQLLALLVLISCTPIAQEAVTKPIADSQPAPPAPEPVLKPEITPTPPPIVEAPPAEEVEEPQLSPKEQCIQTCSDKCDASAHQACTQKERSQCKALCGDIIDPSACTQACTYLNQPNQCKQFMINFCTTQCEGLCV